MATANLSGLSHPDEIALAWSKFLLDDLIEKREARVQPIRAALYTFEMDGETPAVPTTGVFFDPDELDSFEKLSSLCEPSYAYLAVLPGQPIPKGSWEGGPAEERKRQPLGVPQEVIEEGPSDWYLMAVFVSPTVSMTFCGRFYQDTFSIVKPIYGTYGGYLSNLLRTDQ
jgi:hypothetical protein